jgi:glycerol-3-phosphate cytidylyltransferase-like family protein
VHDHGEKLVLALQKPERRSQMIEAVGWCTEVFYEAVEKADQHPISLYGRRIVALIIEFMIEDHGRRRRMKDQAKIDQLRRDAKKKPTSTDTRTAKITDTLLKMKQAADSELLVLYHLKQRAHSTDAIRSEVLKEFMIEHYGIDPAALGFTTDEETGERKT